MHLLTRSFAAFLKFIRLISVVLTDGLSRQFEAINRRIHGLPAEAINEKYADLERGMKQLERKLKEGSVLDTGNRGSNKVSAMAQQLTKKVPEVSQSSMNDQAESFRPKPVLNLPQQGGSETCHFCGKRVYLMERMSAEGRFFHRGCFRCEYCATTLRLGGYAFVRDDLLGGVFFCMPHVSMLYYMRNKVLTGRCEPRVDGPHDRRGVQPIATKQIRQELKYFLVFVFFFFCARLSNVCWCFYSARKSRSNPSRAL